MPWANADPVTGVGHTKGTPLVLSVYYFVQIENLADEGATVKIGRVIGSRVCMSNDSHG